MLANALYGVYTSLRNTELSPTEGVSVNTLMDESIQDVEQRGVVSDFSINTGGNMVHPRSPLYCYITMTVRTMQEGRPVEYRVGTDSDQAQADRLYGLATRVKQVCFSLEGDERLVFHVDNRQPLPSFRLIPHP